MKNAFNFFLLNEYFFLKIDFLSVKSTFRLIKHNLKHVLNIFCFYFIEDSFVIEENIDNF
jgi:hypothetical protein